MPAVWELKIVDGGSQIAIRWIGRSCSRFAMRSVGLRFTSPTGRRLQKNAGRLVAIRHFDVQQQRLNCALIVVSSSLGFFRFQGLNGISEIPKNFGLSRRPIQSLLESKLFRV